jgi:AcrR family transcriptional regulator
MASVFMTFHLAAFVRCTNAIVIGVRRTFKPTRERPAFHHPSLPREVLEVARTALEKEGVAGLSLRAVAKEAGVYPTSISHRFGDREGLLAAVVAEGFGELNQALEAVATEGGDGGERDEAAGVRRMLEAYLAFASAHPRLFVVMFAPWTTFERKHRVLQVAGGRAYALLRAQVDRWVAAEKAAADADLVADGLWCTAHGLAVLVIEERAGKRKRRFDTRGILEMALRPLGRRS